MSIPNLNCPECGAGLKSATGFKVGQTVRCRKCDAPFVVEEPEEATEAEEAEEERPKPAKKAVRAAVVNDDEDEEEEKPKQKKKKKRAADDEERSYKNSPLRFIVLGVLVLIMLVLGFLLYQKKKREREAAETVPVANTPAEPVPVVRPIPNVQPNVALPKGEPGKLPNNAKGPAKRGRGPDVGAVATGAVGDLFSGGPVTAQEAKALLAKYPAALPGTWTADLGDGVTEQLIYNTEGGYIITRTGSDARQVSGKYVVLGLAGTKGLKLQLDGARTVTAIFEGDELLHPSQEPGVTAVYRKKK